MKEPDRKNCSERVRISVDRYRICTSRAERQNLSIRMGMRGMTLLTNAFSKKRENLETAYTLSVALYNFCRVRPTLRVTPAMESGLTGPIEAIRPLPSAPGIDEG